MESLLFWLASFTGLRVGSLRLASTSPGIFCPYFSLHVMDNTVAYGAAKTCALTHRFGGKERFKHVGQYILGNTASGVRYAEENVPSVGRWVIDTVPPLLLWDRIASRALLIKLMRTCSI